jgi:hypothetical protein
MSELDRAYAIFRRAAHDLESSALSPSQLRERLRTVSEHVLDILEGDDEPEDVMSRLDRQSQDIADDLRRAQRLMLERGGQDDD